jgi:hypothetical protein
LARSGTLAAEGERDGMRWIRSNIRGLARLALFALAVQIAVTFDHVHLDDATPISAHAAQAAAGHQAVIASVKSDNKGPQSQGTTDTDCPICALIQLASTSAPSVAPPLPMPAKLGGTILQTREGPVFAASPTFAFQARGPPAV